MAGSQRVKLEIKESHCKESLKHIAGHYFDQTPMSSLKDTYEVLRKEL